MYIPSFRFHLSHYLPWPSLLHRPFMAMNRQLIVMKKLKLINRRDYAMQRDKRIGKAFKHHNKYSGCKPCPFRPVVGCAWTLKPNHEQIFFAQPFQVWCVRRPITMPLSPGAQPEIVIYFPIIYFILIKYAVLIYTFKSSNTFPYLYSCTYIIWVRVARKICF